MNIEQSHSTKWADNIPQNIAWCFIDSSNVQQKQSTCTRKKSTVTCHHPHLPPRHCPSSLSIPDPLLTIILIFLHITAHLLSQSLTLYSPSSSSSSSSLPIFSLNPWPSTHHHPHLPPHHCPSSLCIHDSSADVSASCSFLFQHRCRHHCHLRSQCPRFPPVVINAWNRSTTWLSIQMENARISNSNFSKWFEIISRWRSMSLQVGTANSNTVNSKFH